MAYLLEDLLVPLAKEAGIAVPENLDKYDKKKFEHWHVFSAMQLGAPLPYPSAGWDNAKVVAKIPKKQIRKVTQKQLYKLGFQVGYSTP